MWKKKKKLLLWTHFSTTILPKSLPIPSSTPPRISSADATAVLKSPFSTTTSLPSHIICCGQEEVEKPPRLFHLTRIHHFYPNSFTIHRKGFSSSDYERKVLSSRCWNCNAIAPPFLVCESCLAIQPVDHSVDYFRIFGLDKRYDIEEGDRKNLEGKYKEWQKKLHPDLVHTKSKQEREYAAEQSARVTDAYRTLSNPLSRAVYILKLEGVHVDEEMTTVSDMELVTEILEIREAVEEAAAADDAEALNRIQAQTREKFGTWSESFANAFKGQKFDEAMASIQRMTYYKRVDEEIVKKL